MVERKASRDPSIEETVEVGEGFWRRETDAAGELGTTDVIMEEGVLPGRGKVLVSWSVRGGALL